MDPLNSHLYSVIQHSGLTTFQVTSSERAIHDLSRSVLTIFTYLFIQFYNYNNNNKYLIREIAAEHVQVCSLKDDSVGFYHSLLCSGNINTNS
jgi:hypothetical protein